MHFTVDSRYVPATKHLEALRNTITEYGEIINHYRYMKKHLQPGIPKKRVRFVIACENKKGMMEVDSLIAQVDSEGKKFGGKVFLTTDRLLLGTEALEKGLLMLKAIKNKTTGLYKLGIVELSEHSIMETHNEWILNGK